MKTVKIKKLVENAKIPTYANHGDAGADLYSIENAVIEPLSRKTISTGIAIELPEGYVGLIHPRSGLAHKKGLSIVNTPGTIDCGYRGELKIILINTDKQQSIEIKEGDRIAQLVIQEFTVASFQLVENFSESERSEKGFGSSGE